MSSIDAGGCHLDQLESARTWAIYQAVRLPDGMWTTIALVVGPCGWADASMTAEALRLGGRQKP
jgi:hypothetical protein